MDTKQLKQRILDLAIRGKLVPQDPNDEPASVLLERIRTEKEQLIAQGKLKKSKTKSSDKPHYENEPFEIPDSWEWVTLHNISTIIGDGLHGTPQYDSRGDYYFINGNNLSEHKIKIKEDTKRVSENEYLKYQKPLNETSILVSINGTIGNVGTYNGERVILGKSACYINLSALLHKVYFCYLVESDYFIKYAFKSATGSTIKNVPLKAINEFFVPLPPFNEQKRIVEAIEQWFELIDQLERNKQDLQEAIKQTKAKVLALAIHGKLVPQNPNNEPAIELLKRINPNFKPCDTSHYENLPDGWAICQLENIVNYEQPTQYIVESTDYDDEYKTPVLTAGKSFILGYTNESKGIYNNLPTIIFDDFTTDSRLVDFPFKVKSSAMKILQVNKEINIQYVAYFMSITRLVGNTHKRYWISEYSKIQIPIPPKEEQNRIVQVIAEIEKKLQTISAEL